MERHPGEELDPDAEAPCQRAVRHQFVTQEQVVDMTGRKGSANRASQCGTRHQSLRPFPPVLNEPGTASARAREGHKCARILIDRKRRNDWLHESPSGDATS